MRRLLLRIVAACGLILLTALPAHADVTRRMRIDIEVRVDGRTIAGSAVWEMTASKPFNPLRQGMEFEAEVNGEAIYLPVGPNEALFAIRRRLNSSPSITYGAFLFRCGVNGLEDLSTFKGGCDLKNTPEIVRATGPLETLELPRLEYRETGPIQTGRVEVTKFHVSTTDEPITRGLTARFPWIERLALPSGEYPPDRPQDGGFSPGELYVLDFIAE